MSSQRLSSLLLLALVTAAAPACGDKAGGVGLPDAPTPVTITTSVAAGEAAERAGDVALQRSTSAAMDSIPMTGSTAAHRRSTLSARVSGIVAQVNVREGDRVKEGDVLVVFDDRDVALQVKAAGAAIAAARVGVDTAKVEADRAEQLVKSKAIPSQQRDLASAQWRGARAQLQQALVGKEMAEARLSDTAIKAPYDAVVIMRHANEGEYIMTMPPGPLVTLEEVGVIDVRVAVPASRLGEITVGTPVRVSVPSRKITREGEVTRLIPTMDPRTRTATAIIELVDPDAALIPGLFAEVQVLRAADAPAPEVTP
ncbi:MAG: hypothetical protein CVU56_25350 [Deltaproteobacteria bacterium HGW-Deltaproteobacteria-14]|jgi:RND family efflux transporter MFP subunit|nr:MAG: hypothetical protein CVU56_25350 [Deltaproteobacteria bacterium HGW-Deltaproteobacteria-14]